VVRHAESEANKARVFSGHSDPGLTELGRRQAAAVGQRLAGEAVQRVVSSDLRRASETGKEIARALDVPHDSDPRLREMFYGEWEGKTQEEIVERDRDVWERLARPSADFRAPGGESVAEVRERVHSAYLEIVAAHAGEEAVLVAHGNAIGLLLVALLDLPYENSWRFQLQNTGVTVIHDFDGTPVLASVNETAHLTGIE
jgi:broad specificity phosphatase PhoE